MCRIAGIVNFHSRPTPSQMIQMRDAMQRGGPDDAGIYLDDRFPLAFGFRRLSILDLSDHGRQPMTDDRQQVVLLFNGEIYNYAEVKKELTEYNFNSTSDSEVIIYAYLKWGAGCFSRFNGMFAVALLDKRYNKLLFARDHAGIKPLYYCISEGKLHFASEVRAFKNLEPGWPENDEWKKYFLLFGHLPEPVTTLKNVVPLAKGTILEVDLPSLETKSTVFHHRSYEYKITSKDEAIQLVKKTLMESVQRHLVSDAPIGLFLSGGVDSSLLTILASEFVPDSLQTLSIIFENEQFSEKPFQDMVVERTGARHKNFMVTEALFVEHLKDILEAMDQPSNDGINSYFVCKFAKSCGLKAALSGIGADELFGGYQSFYRAQLIGKFKWLLPLISGAGWLLPEDKKRKIEFLKASGATGEYLFNRGFFVPSQVAMLLDCDTKEVADALEKINALMPPVIQRLAPAERMSYLECNLYMQNQLLKDTDYMSMWHGLEVRVPFLDKELMNVVHSIAPQVKFNSSQLKFLLIEAFKDVLPRPIWDRKKQGFTFPFAQWMKQIKPPRENRVSSTMKARMQTEDIHWSRYWAYILAQSY